MQVVSKVLAKRFVKPVHSSAISSRRIRVLNRKLGFLLPQEQPLIGLDVGCGSGELARNLQFSHKMIIISGTDVLVREDAVIDIVKFDGKRLPFEDKSLDFTMLVDVLHHTNHPSLLLKECVRVSRKFILIKDHVCESWWDRWRLSFMDWVGNRAYDVHLPYNYLSQKVWSRLYHKCGLVCETSISRLNLYPQPLSLIFDSNLHFVAKLDIVEISTIKD